MDEDLLKKYNDLYLSVIMRYRDYIEENENLYVAELPGLVTPEDDAVVSFAEGIKGSSYSYDTDFASAAVSARRYVDSLSTISLPIQFWQRTSETMRNAAGDAFDKAVLLCSILIALGNTSSRVLVLTREAERSIAVYFEHAGLTTYIDIEKGIRVFDSKESMLREAMGRTGSESTAYEFNDRMYADIT